jgi:adenine deaminase
MKEMKELKKLISVAKGDKKADIILKNSRVINTFNGEIEESNVAIYGNKIAGIGTYTKANEIFDLDGDFLAPSLINGHTHLESSLLHPEEYARAVVPRGTSTIITDLHELANVCGTKGIQFVLKWSDKLPLDIMISAPSCVPSTDSETSGAEISPNEIKEILFYDNSVGLGEVMNFEGVIKGNEAVLEKLLLIDNRKVRDGHAPGLSGKKLNAYIAAGIQSEHESVQLDEAKEKLKRGMYLMIREGSTEKNLETLLPLINDGNYNRCMFITDDRTCEDLLKEGEMDTIIRKSIDLGLDPIRAFRLATINPATYFQLHNLGAIAPGYMANLMTFKTFKNFKADLVFHHGDLVAKHGNPLFKTPKMKPELRDTFHVKAFSSESFNLTTENISNGKVEYPIIKIIPGQIITKKVINTLHVSDNIILPDIEKDILKVVVVERHRSTGNIGVGFVMGFNLEEGAIASSIAHDSHNIICVGTDNRSIKNAVKKIIHLDGGLTACRNDEVLASISLPIAGLLSPSSLTQVNKEYNHLKKVSNSLGDLPIEPFALLSFLALPVIPELRLTDKGYVDLTEISS